MGRIPSSWQAWITRSNETVRVLFDQVIHACQLDEIRHFWSGYFYNDKFIICPHGKTLKSTDQSLITKETFLKHILKGAIVIFFNAY